MRGVLFDQPHVIAGAGQELRAAGVADRCRIVGGSFFGPAPEHGDAHMLSAVLHDREDEQATDILRNCRRTKTGNSTLPVIEPEVLPRDQGRTGKLTDLNMLVAAGGQERSSTEYAALFAKAGFRLQHAISTASPWSIFEGVPV